jgi:hypothetical protein
VLNIIEEEGTQKSLKKQIITMSQPVGVNANVKEIDTWPEKYFLFMYPCLEEVRQGVNPHTV